MSRTVELVFEIDSKSAAALRARHDGRLRGANRQARECSAGVAVAEVLERLPGVARTGRREAVTMRVFGRRDASIRLVLEEAAGGRRIGASHAVAIVPGLMLRDTVCDAPLEAGALLASIDSLPADFRELFDDRDAVARAARLSAYRTRFLWQAGEGASLDIVLLDAPGLEALPLAQGQGEETGEGSPPDAMRPLCELHLSARCGGEQAGLQCDADVEKASAALWAAAHTFLDALPAFVSLGDAYSRLLGEAGESEPLRAARVDLAGAGTPQEALVAIGANITRHWFGNVRGVRTTSGAEFVHQMRVALRRAKTLAKIFPRWTEGTWRTDVAPGLAWLGTLLGEARDWDVFVDSVLPALAAADIDSSNWSVTLAAAEARRREARARAQAALRDQRYAHLSLGWLAWLAEQRFSTGSAALAEGALRDYVAKRVRRPYERLTAEPPLTALDAAARHRRRIQAKRLRYALEFFEPLVARRTRRNLARQLSAVQSTLGEGSDAAAALRFLEKLDVTPYQQGFARGWCEAINRCAAREGERLVAKLRKPKIARNG